MSRAANLKWLRARGFKVASSLPTKRGGRDALRPLEEIAARMMALDALFTWVVYDERETPARKLRAYVKRNRLESAMTADERRIYRQPRARAARYRPTIGWAQEMMWPLAWVLGYPKAPRVEDKPVRPADAKAMVAMLPRLGEDLDVLLARENPRPYAAVDRLEDRFYCAHNAVRSAQLGGRTVPRGFDTEFGGLVIETRRHGLTWCLSPGTRWAATSLDT